MNDELQAALARAEAAEAEAKALKASFDGHVYVPDQEYIHLRDKAFTAGAEAMWGRCVDALEDKNFVDAALLIRALPIPAQEVK